MAKQSNDQLIAVDQSIHRKPVLANKRWHSQEGLGSSWNMLTSICKSGIWDAIGAMGEGVVGGYLRGSAPVHQPGLAPARIRTRHTTLVDLLVKLWKTSGSATCSTSRLRLAPTASLGVANAHGELY